MKPRKTLYVIHRWLGLVVALQLLAWSIGGLMFSILHIDAVRGEREIGASEFDPLPVDSMRQFPIHLQDELATYANDERGIGSISFVDRGVGARWEVRDVNGDLLILHSANQLLSAEQASHLALRDFAPEARVRSAQLLETNPPTEYRSGVLPAYQVIIDHPKKPHIYVDAHTGRITARRNRQWRVFDFFWMLHTMDYRGRDNFNHIVLTVFSVLAILTAGTGSGLWCWRFVAMAGRRARARRAARTETGPGAI